jgi:ABC-2 type transport system ATP-binding protein
VTQGEVIALLGPNGAGKTTTLEMIESLLTPTSGKIEILGFNPVRQPNEVKKRIGIQLQSSSYYEYLCLTELLKLFATFYGAKIDASKLLKMVGLQEKRKSRVGQLSGGQKQRFAVVSTLVNNPEIIFLDEPTTGLDPQARRNLWGIIRKIRSGGKTVVMTTHYMEEAQILADNILIIDHGKIIASGTPKQLIHKLPNPFRIEISADKCVDDKAVKAISGVVSIRHEEDEQGVHKCIIGVKNIGQSLPNIINLLQKNKISFSDIAVLPSNLEDVFLMLTGKELRD